MIGQLQNTIPGSEVGTLSKAFLMKAAETVDEIGLSFTDTSGRLKGVIPILQEIKREFPDLSQAAAQVNLEKGLRLRRGDQVPTADDDRYAGIGGQQPVGIAGYAKRNNGHRADGRSHEPGHLDKNLRVSFSDRKFVFDLAKGMHFIKLKCRPLRECKNIDVQVEKGEILYVKVDVDTTYYQWVTIKNKNDAIQELEPMHHNFKRSLSIYRQFKLI